MYNHTGLQGRLTATPELRYTPSGTAITSFTLASDTGRKTKDGNRITNFIDCVAWRQQAEFACKYLTKGRLVIVDGEQTSRTYDQVGRRRREDPRRPRRDGPYADQQGPPRDRPDLLP